MHFRKSRTVSTQQHAYSKLFYRPKKKPVSSFTFRACYTKNISILLWCQQLFSSPPDRNRAIFAWTWEHGSCCSYSLLLPIDCFWLIDIVLQAFLSRSSHKLHGTGSTCSDPRLCLKDHGSRVSWKKKCQCAFLFLKKRRKKYLSLDKFVVWTTVFYIFRFVYNIIIQQPIVESSIIRLQLTDASGFSAIVQNIQSLWDPSSSTWS